MYSLYWIWRDSERHRRVGFLSWRSALPVGCMLVFLRSYCFRPSRMPASRTSCSMASTFQGDLQCTPKCERWVGHLWSTSCEWIAVKIQFQPSCLFWLSLQIHNFTPPVKGVSQKSDIWYLGFCYQLSDEERKGTLSWSQLGLCALRVTLWQVNCAFSFKLLKTCCEVRTSSIPKHDNIVLKKKTIYIFMILIKINGCDNVCL